MRHILNCSGYESSGIVMSRGRGVFIHDEAGRSYVDFESGVWCTVLGHNHPRVNRAIRTQLGRITNLGYRYGNRVTEEAAESVLAATGFAEGRCVFLNSGSESVEFAVQAMRFLSGRPLLLVLSESYLSAFGSAGKKDPAEWHVFDWRACTACPSAASCDPGCPRLSEIPFGRIGGWVFEPGNCSGLVRLPPRGLVRVLAERIGRQGGLIAVNEVTTGLGRSGAWFGHHHYEIGPDLVALGKGLGNGYPVSAIAMGPAVAAALAEKDFHHAQSHQNHPLGCAAAREVIAVIREEGLIDRGRCSGEFFRQGLESLQALHPAVREVRGRGLMLVVEFDEALLGRTVSDLYRRLLDAGFVVGCKPAARLLRFYPPLTISSRQVNALLKALEEILGD